jgi:hypothetical protein
MLILVRINKKFLFEISVTMFTLFRVVCCVADFGDMGDLFNGARLQASIGSLDEKWKLVPAFLKMHGIYIVVKKVYFSFLKRVFFFDCFFG